MQGILLRFSITFTAGSLLLLNTIAFAGGGTSAGGDGGRERIHFTESRAYVDFGDHFDCRILGFYNGPLETTLTCTLDDGCTQEDVFDICSGDEIYSPK